MADGVPLDWHVDVPLDHPAFPATQLLSAWALWPADPDRLEFRPGEPLDHRAAAALLRERDAPAAPRAVSLLPPHPTRAGVALAWIQALRELA